MVKGPRPCGDWPDLCIARHALHRVLYEGEHHVADGGCHSSADYQVMTPTGKNDHHDRQVDLVRARHETVRRPFETFGVLCQMFRHPLEKYEIVLKSIANTVQLTTSNGRNSFEVECSEHFLGP